jgi:hypothetical protein
MEQDAGRFYQLAASRSTDPSIRKLLGDLAAAEMQHERTAAEIEIRRLSKEAKGKEDESAKRSFVLQIVQPGLVGLMDGSVSTLPLSLRPLLLRIIRGTHFKLVWQRLLVPEFRWASRKRSRTTESYRDTERRICVGLSAAL